MPPRSVRSRPPSSIVEQYLRSLRTLNLLLVRIVRARLLPEVEAIHAELAPKDTRADGKYDRLATLVRSMRAEFRRKANPKAVDALVKDIDERVKKHTGKETYRVVSSVLGFDPELVDPDFSAHSKAFRKRNIRLITSIDTKLFDRLEKDLRQSIRGGMRVETLAKHIQRNYIASVDDKGRPVNLEARARLIARDQVLKHNANLTEIRQRSAGIEKYTWRTSKDGRTRPEHAALEGKVFKWNESTPIGVKPGEDYQCRCTAEPVIDPELFEN